MAQLIDERGLLRLANAAAFSALVPAADFALGTLLVGSPAPLLQLPAAVRVPDPPPG